MLDRLRQQGVEVDNILKSLNGKEAIYEKFVFKFYNMIKEGEPIENYKDHNELYERIHGLKGVVANLGITPLFDEYVKILDLIKAEKLEQIPSAIDEMNIVQERILKCIKP